MGCRYQPSKIPEEPDGLLSKQRGGWLSERLDTTNAAGKMVFRMLAVLAEFERDLVSERTAAALHFKRQSKELVGNIPFGYDLAPDGIHLLQNELEQGAIREIKKLRAAGYSYRQIADEINRRGIKTKKGKAEWKHTAIKRILDRNAA